MYNKETARILIVDDEPVNLKLLNKMLSAQGYGDLVLVQDSRQVVDVYRQRNFSLVTGKTLEIG